MTWLRRLEGAGLFALLCAAALYAAGLKPIFPAWISAEDWAQYDVALNKTHAEDARILANVEAGLRAIFKEMRAGTIKRNKLCLDRLNPLKDDLETVNRVDGYISEATSTCSVGRAVTDYVSEGASSLGLISAEEAKKTKKEKEKRAADLWAKYFGDSKTLEARLKAVMTKGVVESGAARNKLALQIAGLGDGVVLSIYDARFSVLRVKSTEAAHAAKDEVLYLRASSVVTTALVTAATDYITKKAVRTAAKSLGFRALSFAGGVNPLAVIAKVGWLVIEYGAEARKLSKGEKLNSSDGARLAAVVRAKLTELENAFVASAMEDLRRRFAARHLAERRLERSLVVFVPHAWRGRDFARAFGG